MPLAMTPPRAFVISGASSALGQALIEYLSRDPAVSILATSRGAIEAGPDREGRIQYMAGIDLLKPDDLRRLADRASTVLPGRFHIVHCVGYFPGFTPVTSISLADVRQVYEANVVTLHAMLAAFVPLMIQRGGGYAIAFSSHSVYQCYPYMATFTAAKAAVESLMRSTAHEFAKQGIVSTALALATIDSPAERRLVPHGDFEHWLKPEQVCRVIDSITVHDFGIMNGNTIHLYNHSDSYFGQGYLERVQPVTPPEIVPMPTQEL
jgi:NAD(P)-dependent dehydrogenase (short-subunit alcohol dehydrogenase family)